MSPSTGLLFRDAETDDSPALDDQALARLEHEIGRVGFNQLLDVLCSTMIERRTAMIAAVRDKDSDRMSHLAHTMKTSSRYVGASRLAEACVALEEAVRDGSHDVVELAIELINASKRVSVALAERSIARP